MPPRVPPPRRLDDRSSDVPYYNNRSDLVYQRGDEIPVNSPEAYQRWNGDYHAPSAYSYRDDYGYYQRPDFPPFPPNSYHNDFNRGWEPSHGYHAAHSYLPPMPPQQMPPPSERFYHTGPPFPPPPSSERYVPPHLRAQSPGRATSPNPQAMPPPAHSRFEDPPYQKEQPFIPILPPKEYLDLSNPAINTAQKSDKVIPKLLVLDLNGALIYRSGGRNTERTSYPRPYLGNFLEYLFGKQNEVPVHEEYDQSARPWEVFVWSSAQPHNVRGMVEGGFGKKWSRGVYEPEDEEAVQERRAKGEGRLTGVWARDKMDLNQNDYKRKVQTFKDLRKVIAYLNDPDNENITLPTTYDEKRIMLLDDSPRKAINQPWNQLVLPEFDKKEWQAAKAAVDAGDPSAEDSDMDSYLLAVVGILEELKTVDNVASWIRGGGLTRIKQEKEQQTTPDTANSEDVSLEDLPSHDDYKHWYSFPSVVKYWTEQGITALARRSIQVSHGIDQHGRALREKGTRDESPPGHYPSAHYTKSRAWSPSAPTSPSSITRRSPSPSSPAKARNGSPRRHIHTQAELPAADNFNSYMPIDGPSGSAHATGESSRQAAEASDMNYPSSVKTDTWRTFKASDVSAYLFDVADRASSNYTIQDHHQYQHPSQIQEAIRFVAHYLSALSPIQYDNSEDGEWTGNERPERRQGGDFGQRSGGEKWQNGAKGDKASPKKGKGQANHPSRTEVTKAKQAASKRKKGKKAAKQAANTNQISQATVATSGQVNDHPMTGREDLPNQNQAGLSVALQRPSPSASAVSQDVKAQRVPAWAKVSIELSAGGLLKATNGWAPASPEVESTMQHLEKQLDTEIGSSIPDKKFVRLPQTKPPGIPPSLWNGIHEVMKDAGVGSGKKGKGRKLDYAKRKNIVHLAMYREMLNAQVGDGTVLTRKQRREANKRAMEDKALAHQGESGGQHHQERMET